MTQPANELSYVTTDSKGLRYIALRQRIIIICILVYFGAVALQFVMPVLMQFISRLRMDWLVITLFFGGTLLLILANYIIAIICVFGLAIRLFGTGKGILYGVLTFVPLVNLVILLIVNARATKTLRANGVKVGFFGASGIPE